MFSRRSVDGMSSSRELYDTCTSHCPHIPRGRAGYPHPCTPLPAHLAHTAQARPHVREVDVRPLVGSVSPHYEGLGPSPAAMLDETSRSSACRKGRGTAGSWLLVIYLGRSLISH